MKNDYKKLLLAELESNKKEYAGVEYGMLRRSLLKGTAMRMMNDASSLEEVKDIFSAHDSLSYNNPI